jgi:hypothetical protein
VCLDPEKQQNRHIKLNKTPIFFWAETQKQPQELQIRRNAPFFRNLFSRAVKSGSMRALAPEVLLSCPVQTFPQPV